MVTNLLKKIRRTLQFDFRQCSDSKFTKGKGDDGGKVGG